MDEISTVTAEPAAPRRTPWIVAGVAIVAVAAGLGIGLGLGSHSPSASPAAAGSASAAASPTPFELVGSISVPFLGTDLYAPQAADPSQAPGKGPDVRDPCVTEGGFTDVSEGTAVTIGGPDGKTVAVGSLEAGQVEAQPNSNAAECTFDFSVPVPSGLSEYTVTVSHRGTQVFTQEQVVDGTVDLTLGG